MHLLSKTPKISLEFTTPSNPIAEKNILDAANILQVFHTDFSCVNFGGGHISPARAMMIIDKLKNQFNMPIVGYLRRSFIDKKSFNSIVDIYQQAGINMIFLTEGRRLNSNPETTNHYPSLTEAITVLKQINPKIKLAVEARPEHHRDEIDLIKSVIDLGIDEIVTRFSFSTDTTLRFLSKLTNYGTLPKIRIGVMPFENPSKTFLTAHRLNVQVPQFIQKLFNDYPEYDTINCSISTHILLSQVQQYIEAGYLNFHIRYGRYHNAIEALCRYYNIPLRNPQLINNNTPLSLDKTTVAI